MGVSRTEFTERIFLSALPQRAKQHRAYSFRVVMGPSYRADAWAALDPDPSLSTALARQTY